MWSYWLKGLNEFLEREPDWEGVELLKKYPRQATQLEKDLALQI